MPPVSLEGRLVQDSPEALSCVLEHGTILTLYTHNIDELL